jgi:hypothetical protein
MGDVPSGGFVLTTTEGSDANRQDVSINTLRAIANILGIPQLDDSARSIYVFRNRKKPHRE